MKKLTVLFFALPVFLFTLAGLSGCATTGSPHSTDLLSVAGFSTKTPKTDKQKEIYDDLPSGQILTGIVNGQRLYGYKEESRGVVYVGGEKQYQNYKRLAEKQGSSKASLTAVEMDPATIKRYRTLVPYGFWQ